jgi:hypothetical protein
VREAAILPLFLPFPHIACVSGLTQVPGGQEDTAFPETGVFADLGGGDVVLKLPVPDGEMLRCVQGAFGSYSHSGESTLHDIDLDTTNDADEEVYAPASGVAYVHTESDELNFGEHVNIDLGDGTYAVVAHLSEVFIKDGVEVTEGQLVGYEGCTGNCTGDHVHIGRHEGDPALMAEYGVSVPVSYWTEDADLGGGFRTVAGDDIVCGVTSWGDEVDGHWYRSDLAVPLWHPDGTLIMGAYESRVYRLDEGDARWIETEEVFESYGYDFDDVVVVSDEELNGCLGAGDVIDGDGLVDAFEDPDGQMWLVVAPLSRSDRYRLRVQTTAWESVLASWGLSYNASNPPQPTDGDHTYLVDWPEAQGFARFRDGTLLKEESHSDVYVVSNTVAAPIKDWTTYLLLGFSDRFILTVPDGAVATVQEAVGDCAADLWCVDHDAVASCGGVNIEDTSGTIVIASDDSDAEENAYEEESPEASDGGEPEDYDPEERDEDPSPCTDGDLDLYCTEATNGTDCNDGDAGINPGAEEVCGDGIDQDCSGADEACPDADPNNDSSSSSDDTGSLESVSSSDSADSDDAGDSSSSSTARTLTIRWQTPFAATADTITLSGEYVFASGSYGFTWRELAEASSASEIAYAVAGVGSGDTLRFSVEYVDAIGNISWSCIGPYPSGTSQGSVNADVDGTAISINTADDPTSDGCGLILEVP